jgi:hypothetical protein
MVRFRYNAAAAVACLVAAIGAVPLASAHWLFLPLVLVPLLVAGWAWRAGTDANANGLLVQALLGSRFVPWSQVEALVVGKRRRVYAKTTAGTAVRLPGVGPGDLPRLVAASGQELRTAA